jgi:5'-nucleotidase
VSDLPVPSGASEVPSPTRRSFPASDRFVPKPERVFVNRNLRFSQIQAIGFDLDHTLAHYDDLPLEKLAFELTKKKLVEKRGYPAEVLRFKYDPMFVVRGLVVDKVRGNVIKMDYFRYVARAYHGLRRLDAEERARTYNERSPRFAGEGFASVDTLFHLPEVALYALLIDLFERRGERPDYVKMYDDVRAMIDEAHGDGSLKAVITKAVGSFVRRDARLPMVLEEFRRAGKKLFLLTNSEWYYSATLLAHLLERRKNDKPWEQYFDVLVVASRKPAFFAVDAGIKEPERIATATGVPAWAGGNAAYLEKQLGVSGDEILYFGDHTYGDILRSKKSLGWRTAMIVPEVEREVAVTQDQARAYKTLERLAHEHDQIEIEKAALGREWRTLALALGGEEGDLRAAALLGLHDPQRAQPPVPAPAAALVTAADAGGRDAAAAPNGDLPARLQALLSGTGSGPGGRRTRGDRRRAGRVRELGELAHRIADLDHRAASLAGRIRSLRRKVEAAYNPYWGSVFREGNEASRFGHQLKDFACVYTSDVENFLHYPWNYYFQSPVSVMPHDL